MAGRLKLGQILVNRGLLEPDQLATALAAQQTSGARLGMTLVRLGFVDEETLIRTLAGQLKLPVARIRGKRVSPEVLECVGVDIAEKHRCLPLFFKQDRGERVLFVAMEDPSDEEALEEIAAASGETVRAVLVGPTELEEALQRHYHWASLTGESPEWLASRGPSEDPTRHEAPPDPASGSDDDWAPEPESPTGRHPDDEEGLDPGLAGDGDGFDAGPGGDEDAYGAGFETDPDDLGLDLEGGDGGLDLGLEGEMAADPDPLAAALLPESPPQAPGETRPEALDPNIILRALSQLLVEKGVIGRDELVQRVGELAARAASRG